MSAEHSAAPVQKVDVRALRAIVLTVAFAVEARRVLTEMDIVEQISPEAAEALSRVIPARMQWASIENTAPEVLDYVAEQLGVLALREDE